MKTRQILYRMKCTTVVFSLVFVGLMFFSVSMAKAAVTSVTIAGDLQSEAGCAGDWDPACAATHLTYDSTDDVWQGNFAITAGSYNYVAALNDSLTNYYGANAQLNGANIGLILGSPATVKFYYDDKSHWVTSNSNSVIAVLAGSFQSELGCAGDWDPSCLRAWLQDPDGDGIYTFETSGIPAGSYQFKIAINEGWAENYGDGGTLGGANIPFTVAADGSTVRFSYNAGTHITSVQISIVAIASATYDAGTGVLAITASNMTTGDSIDSGKLTLSGEGGGTRTLTSGSFNAGSGTAVSITLNASDKAAVNLIFNKNGTRSTDNTTYNLAAADDWDSTVISGDTSDAVNGVTVGNVAAPVTTTTTAITTTTTATAITTTTTMPDTGCKLSIKPDAVKKPILWPFRIFRISGPEGTVFTRQDRPEWNSDAIKTLFKIKLKDGSMFAVVYMNLLTAEAGLYKAIIGDCTGWVELQER